MCWRPVSTILLIYIYIKLSPKWKSFHEQQVFYFRFYILWENFSKIGPIIKKIQKFSDDPLKTIIKRMLRVYINFKRVVKGLL